MWSILSNRGHGQSISRGASIVIGACLLVASAAMFSALPQSGDIVPSDSYYLEAAAFVHDSPPARRQDAWFDGDQQAQLPFGMEIEPTERLQRNGAPSKRLSIANKHYWRAVARTPHAPPSHKACLISSLRASVGQATPASA
jgi:hypothetical protein